MYNEPLLEVYHKIKDEDYFLGVISNQDFIISDESWNDFKKDIFISNNSKLIEKVNKIRLEKKRINNV